MIELTEACVRGCSMFGRHFDECVDERCRGCLPRRAQHGHLCWPCHRRFQLMLTDAPTVHRWLTGNMTAGEGAARAKDDYETRPGGEDGAPTPVKLAILDTRDLLADRLAAWADDWAEHHRVSAPRHSVDADSEFLLRWLPGLEKVDWIGDWWEELAECMVDAHALAPWRPVMTRLPEVACPRCTAVNMAIFGGDEDATCLTCGEMILAKHFQLWERIVKDDEAVAG
jgi:hypothetical protein